MASAVLALALALVSRPASASDCPQGDSALVVDTAAHKLRLCEKGVAVKAYRVSLGRGGTGKTKEGDNKTPLGIYALGIPQPSGRFGTFIPFGYPRQDQAAAGLTGGDVGVHGPDRPYAWLGPANLLFDWTAGCVAVSSDAAIQAIAAWVVAKRVPFIVLK